MFPLLRMGPVISRMSEKYMAHSDQIAVGEASSHSPMKV